MGINIRQKRIVKAYLQMKRYLRCIPKVTIGLVSVIRNYLLHQSMPGRKVDIQVIKVQQLPAEPKM